jgi:hypothetical protein
MTASGRHRVRVRRAASSGVLVVPMAIALPAGIVYLAAAALVVVECFADDRALPMLAVAVSAIMVAASDYRAPGVDAQVFVFALVYVAALVEIWRNTHGAL